MSALPGTLDEVRGLRGARWIRESTAGQADAFGPDAQREQQDRAFERFGLADTGQTWQVAHSGRTIDRTPAWADMLAAAGRAYDVLVVGYVSRFARDLRAAVNARHELHQRGAAILFADERLLSSDEEAWEHWAREAVEAEAYSRRLAKRIREGYAAKFRRHGDQGGSAPLGFRRGVARPFLLEPDPRTIGLVVGLFERYAARDVTIAELGASMDIAPTALRVILANPIYNGWVRRHRRGRDEERSPAPWRGDPPVDDDLWARVAEVRARRYTGGGRPRPVHQHLLAGRLACADCGRPLNSEGRRRPARVDRLYRHRLPCGAWTHETIAADRVDAAIEGQLLAARFRPEHVAGLRRLAAESMPGPAVADLRRRQLERDLAQRAAAHAARRLATDAYLAEHARLSAELDRLADERPAAPSIDPDLAARRLGDWQATYRQIPDAERGALLRAIYDRIEVAGDGRLRVALTPDAERHGLALALPEQVMLALARPAGFEPATRCLEGSCSIRLSYGSLPHAF